MNLPFDTTGLNAAEVNSLEASYAALQSKFSLDISTQINPELARFDVMRCYDDANQYKSYSEGGIIKIATPVNDCYLVFIKLWFHEHRSGQWGMENADIFTYRIWALVRQQKDFGCALIRKETFTDRVLSVVHPVELEFDDDKSFSRKCYVTANDAEKAKNAMTWNFRNALMGIELGDFCIEAAGNDLLIGNNDRLSPDNAILTAEIACKIASACR